MTLTALEWRVIEALRRGPLTAAELVHETEIPRGTLGNVLLNLRDDGAVRVKTLRYRGKGNGSGKALHVYGLGRLAPDQVQP